MNRTLVWTSKGGTGKALADDTLIPTPSGWRRMDDLAVSDQVFDERGKQCAVTGVHPQPPGRACFELEFSDGATLVADADHLWSTIDLVARRTAAYLAQGGKRPLDHLGGQSRHRGVYRTPAGRWYTQVQHAGVYHGLGTYDSEDEAGCVADAFRRQHLRPRGAAAARPAIRTTAQIRDTLVVRGEANHAIPVCGALDYPERQLPIDPYVLGAWLGDGHSADARITSLDPEIRNHIERAGYATRNHCQRSDRTPTFGISRLHSQLRAAGALDNKHVPVEYLTASGEQRLALLQGLMDTDGYCDPRQGTVEFCSTRRVLADAVHELFLSLGVKATIRTGEARLYGRLIGPSYQVCATTDLPVFRLLRKLAGLKPQPARSPRRLRYITDVRPVPSVPVRCISVDAPSRLYLAGRAMIPTHNTTTVANLGPELARLGRRVLMVGFDPQGDLEATFGIADEDPDIVRVEQLLDGSGDPRTAPVTIAMPEPQPEAEPAGSLRLLASSSQLTGATANLTRRHFHDLNRVLDTFDDVDDVLIDTQGAVSPLSHTAVRAARSVLFTMEPGYYEYRALAARLDDLEQLGWGIHPLGVLFVRTAARSRHLREYREHFSDPDAFGEPLHTFAGHVRQQASVREHPRRGQPTVLAEPNSNVAQDYRAVAAELVARLALVA